MQWIISDCHGMIFTLTSLLEKIRGYDSDAKFVFVGDYVDRGKNNKQVVDLMIEMQSQGAICLRGNHDNVIDWMVNNQHYIGHISEYVSGKPTYYNVTNWWIHNGLGPTLESYGVELPGGYGCVMHPEACLDVFNGFAARMPRSHKDFFLNLPLYWENDTHFACHAYYKPNAPLPRKISWTSDEVADMTLWSRFSNFDLTTPTQWDRIGVFGHTPVKNYGASAPIKWDKIRLIDTGSFMRDGYICGYSCETDDFFLYPSDSRDF